MVKTPLEREEFIEQNLGLVHAICKRFIGKGIDYDDLYQAGCMGLVKAFDAFDNERGFQFSTYAVPVIMGAVRRLFRDGCSVKVSRSVKELGLRIAREKECFQQENGCEPTVGELAERIGVSSEEIAEAVCANQATVSLTIEQDNDITEMDLPVCDLQEEINDRLVLEEALSKLEDNERQLIEYRYFNAFTQSKTADALNMTQVQVSRTERKVLLKLRHLLK